MKPFWLLRGDDTGESLFGGFVKAGSASVQRGHVAVHSCPAQQKIRLTVQGSSVDRVARAGMNHGRVQILGVLLRGFAL